MSSSKLDKLESNKGLINLLEKHYRSNEIINEILEFNDGDLNRLKERTKTQPKLLTAIVKNEYNSDVIHKIFCNKNDKIYNNFLKYKEFIILLLENKCPAERVIHMYNLVKYKLSFYATLDSFIGSFDRKCLFGHGHYNLVNSIAHSIFKYNYYSHKPNLSRFHDLIVSPATLNRIWTFVYNQNIKTIAKCSKNPELFYLVMKNMLIDTMPILLERSDYETINVKNSKELLDFLLDERLITLAQDEKDLINDFWVLRLLKTNNLTINQLLYYSMQVKSIVDKHKKKETCNHLNNDKKLSLGDDIFFQLKKVEYDRDKPPSLMELSVKSIIENPQMHLSQVEVFKQSCPKTY